MSTRKRPGLGRGLDSLIPGSTEPVSLGTATLEIPVEQIVPNPHQPRTVFTEEDLSELADSIRVHGVIQPLIVMPAANERYTLIAGERRLQAAIRAGLRSVPAVQRTASPQELLEIALIENIQRADLSPLEEAEAYRHLVEDFRQTQEAIAKSVGKSRASVANTLRLLKLPVEVQREIAAGNISEGHGRAILGLADAQAQAALAKTVIGQSLSVRQAEELSRILGSLPTPQAQLSALKTIQEHNLNPSQAEELVKKLLGQKPTTALPRPVKKPEVKSLEEQLMNELGTKVSLNQHGKGGSLVIHYYSEEELNTLVSRLLKNHTE